MGCDDNLGWRGKASKGTLTSKPRLRKGASSADLGSVLWAEGSASTMAQKYRVLDSF